MTSPEISKELEGKRVTIIVTENGQERGISNVLLEKITDSFLIYLTEENRVVIPINKICKIKEKLNGQNEI